MHGKFLRWKFAIDLGLGKKTYSTSGMCVPTLPGVIVDMTNGEYSSVSSGGGGGGKDFVYPIW